MKIKLLEPIGVPAETIEEYARKLTEMGHEFEWFDTVTTDPKELAVRSAGSDVVMIANHPYPESVILSDPDLKMISVAFTGIDHVAADTCKEKGIMICNAAGYSNQTVAELVIGMAVSGLRNIRKADIQLRKGGTSAGLSLIHI